MRALILVAGMLVTAPAVATEPEGSPPTLNLVCQGKAARDETISPGLFGGPKAAQRVYYEDAVYVRLRSDDTGEARLPKKIQSKYKQDKDGWFPLINVVRTNDLIDGQVRLHSMYKPRFHIDRITGELTINGSLADFAGQCVTYDPNAPATKF